MHVVNDVHRIIIYTRHFLQHFLVIGKHFLEIQFIAAQYRNTLHHYRTGIFASTAIDGKQKRFCQITTCSEELDMTTYVLIRHTTSDSIIVRTAHFTHQIIVFILNRRCINGNLRTKVLKTFGQLRAPQHR